MIGYQQVPGDPESFNHQPTWTMNDVPHPLDSTVHPHIIDNIIGHASHASLLRLRTVSRAILVKADAGLLPGHLIITGMCPSAPADGNKPSGPGRGLSTLPRASIIVSSPHCRIPTFEKLAGVSSPVLLQLSPPSWTTST